MSEWEIEKLWYAGMPPPCAHRPPHDRKEAEYAASVGCVDCQTFMEYVRSHE